MKCICRFKNDPCAGSSNRNGTCYTESECSNKGGTNAGSCAQVSYLVGYYWLFHRKNLKQFLCISQIMLKINLQDDFFNFRASECVAYVSTTNQSTYALVFFNSL